MALKHYVHESMISACSRRTRLKWEASRDLQRAMVKKGADEATLHVYAEKLAEALRAKA